MSVFKVVLPNPIQTTMYVAGPNRNIRELKNNDTFTDCNYWKRFTYPKLSKEQAFIEILEDDGSFYSDFAEENTYPRTFELTVANPSNFVDNIVDIIGETNGYAVFVQIANHGNTSVKCRINGITNAVFDLGSGDVQLFNYGDLTVSKLEFQNNTEGGDDVDIQILTSIRSLCTS